MPGRVLTSLFVVFALGVPAGAGAHVRVLPAEAEAGAYTVLRANVPDESAELTTTRVEVRFPPGFTYVFSQPVAGWAVDVKMTKAAKSAISGQVTRHGSAG